MPVNFRKNLVLIGMPGAGKSTVGVILAKRTARGFIDSDLLIQTTQQKSLQEIVDQQGYERLREIEEESLLSIQVDNTVISTGGSAVYSEVAMQHLKENGEIIFLDVELNELEKRVGDYRERGIAKKKEQSFADLFEERSKLYKKQADLIIQCHDLTPEMICDIVCRFEQN